ncbi:pyocin knob domain-containing protein [Photorhabdus kayaii]|uniref:pyocin knob domain-containing protein n=1 Tax=Photorhabdus kayaii TaxID=230088 RepID=UPI0021D5182C|nr:pyocin knob domain-containing protein [Photorhabdus kayaii]
MAKSAVPNNRRINGKVLSGDVDITSQDIFNGQAISIPDKADLNDYQTPGLYYQGLNVQATAGKNYPEASAGSLVVLQAAGTIQRYFVYNSSRIYTRALYPWSGPGWTPWAQEYNTQNKPIASELGLTDTVNLAKSAYPKSGGVLNGYVDATGSISGRGVYEYPSIRVYSAVNKPSPGELGAYTTGECDNRYALKNNVGVINLRLGSWVTEGGWTDETKDWSAPSGHVLVGLGTVMWSSGRQHLASAHYRPVQAYINGIWVTISSI